MGPLRVPAYCSFHIRCYHSIRGFEGQQIENIQGVAADSRPRITHRLVEEAYHRYNNLEESNGDGTDYTWYPVATYHDDMVNMKRMVTIVETLKVYAYRVQEWPPAATRSRRAWPEVQRAAREDEVSRLLAFLDWSEPAEHARAMVGRPQTSAAATTTEQVGHDIGSQNLPPPPYPSRTN